MPLSFRCLSITIKLLCAGHLKLCRLRCTGEGDYITNVLHPGNKENKSFKAQTKASMRARAIPAGI